MELVIKNAKIYDMHSPLNGGRHTLWIRKGRLYAIDKRPTQGISCIEGTDLVLSPSWCDLRAHFCDPGEEHKEDLHTGLQAAAAGGFAEVALLPDTKPVLQSKAQLHYLYEKAQSSGLQIHPVAALTKDQAGTALTELLDLREAGAIAFSDGLRPLNNLQLLTQALRYLRPFGGVILHRVEEASLAAAGAMHEGATSTALGLPGIPAHAEELMLHSALRVLDYTGGKLHFSCLSAAGTVPLLRKARARGQQVSADVSVHQLFFEDKALRGFHTEHKNSPPYRSASDRRALCRAVAAGEVQAIVSDHRPQAPEDKMRPFAEAADGVIALQCVLPILLRLQKELPLGAALQALYEGPRRVLGLPVPTVQLGEKACYTVFDAKACWRFDQSSNYSKSTNSPFYGEELVGKVVAVLNGKQNLVPSVA